jgi:hypothetical protein
MAMFLLFGLQMEILMEWYRWIVYPYTRMQQKRKNSLTPTFGQMPGTSFFLE